MATTLANARIALSKAIADYWSGTTTGAGSTTTVVDTALMAKANDWINDNAHMLVVDMTGDTYNNIERKISSLDNTTGTLTVLAIGGALGASATYEVHRLFTAADKRIALKQACYDSFPYIHKKIRDVSKVSGNWLKDGSFEVWTATTTPTYWTATTLTATQTSTAGLKKNGSYSAKLNTATGTLKQTITLQEDLNMLAGCHIYFTVQVKTDKASSVRISIYDGTDTTYSDYNDQITGWTTDNEPMEVEAIIGDNPSEVTFTIHLADAAATAYVDDARVIGGDYRKVYIGNLGLARNLPHQVLIEPEYYYQGDDWYLIHDIEYDETTGYMYLPSYIEADRRLRVVGIGYLDFLKSGVSSTDWDAEVAVDAPQLDILTTNAVIYLYSQMSLPNFSTGDRRDYQDSMTYWSQVLNQKISQFAMQPPAATMNFTV